jgi:lysophospholipase
VTEAAPFHAEVADAPEGGRGWWLTTSDGVRLRAVVWTGGTRGTAVIFPGRTEFAEKYGRVAGRLVARGFAVAVIDWRGQGLSDRHPVNPLLGYVADFREYQRDVAALMELDARLGLPEPHYMVAHSMGGCIGLRTLLERPDFRAAVFSAPMWHLQMRAATRELTSKMTRLASLVGLGGRLLPGASQQPTLLAATFEDNALTSDRATFDWCLRQITAHPELALAGPSMQWTYAALEEMARLYVAPLPRLPVLALLGGDEEVVSPSVIRKQVSRMAEGELAEFPAARHELFMERPAIVEQVWERINRFLDALPATRRSTPVDYRSAGE